MYIQIYELTGAWICATELDTQKGLSNMLGAYALLDTIHLPRQRSSERAGVRATFILPTLLLVPRLSSVAVLAVA